MLNKVVFLDRDGVINKVALPHDYIKTWNEFELFDGVATAIKKLNDAQYIVCVVTNQRGVAQGIMSMEDVNEIHKQMQCKLELSGAHLDAIFVCPHENGTCTCRKPQTGMFQQAEAIYEIDKNSSYMIGDSESDILAGKKFGIKTIAITIKEFAADYKCNSLFEAVNYILQQEVK